MSQVQRSKGSGGNPLDLQREAITGSIGSPSAVDHRGSVTACLKHKAHRRNSLQRLLPLYFGLECIRESVPRLSTRHLVCMLPLGLVPACSFRPNGVKLSTAQEGHPQFPKAGKSLLSIMVYGSTFPFELEEKIQVHNIGKSPESFKMFSFPTNKFKGAMCSSI